MFATSGLRCPVCSTAVPGYLYCLTFVSRCPFTVTSQCFPNVFYTIVLFVFFAAFISIPYCSQVESSLSIMLKLMLTLCQYLGIKRHNPVE